MEACAMPASVPEVLAAWMQPFAVYFLGSTSRRNTLTEGVAMRAGRRRSDRALRAVLPRPPGRPGVAQQENRRRVWAAIAAGQSSETAAIEVGVSPAVGPRWFRECRASTGCPL